MISVYDPIKKEVTIDDTTYSFYCGELQDEIALTLFGYTAGTLTLQEAYIRLLKIQQDGGNVQTQQT